MTEIKAPYTTNTIELDSNIVGFDFPTLDLIVCRACVLEDPTVLNEPVNTVTGVERDHLNVAIERFALRKNNPVVENLFCSLGTCEHPLVLHEHVIQSRGDGTFFCFGCTLEWSQQEVATALAQEDSHDLTENEAIQQLLRMWTEASEGFIKVEEDHIYIRSDKNNTTRYHMLSYRLGDLTIYQTIEGEKYQQHVVFGPDRTKPLMAALLQMHLDILRETEENNKRWKEALGDLSDGHPF